VALRWQSRHDTDNDRTPFIRMLARSIGGPVYFVGPGLWLPTSTPPLAMNVMYQDEGDTAEFRFSSEAAADNPVETIARHSGGSGDFRAWRVSAANTEV
jgi:hypothetical protein